MSLLTSTRIFILLSLCLSIQSATLLSGDNQNSGNELGVDQCSHQHFLIVDKFFIDSIWKHIEAPQHNYKFVQCSREAHVGSKYREYKFAVEMGEVECNFTFKVHDVTTEKTLEEFNPLEINDFNKCKEAIHARYPVIEKKQDLINQINADDIETSDLHPLFSDIPEVAHKDDIETSGLHPLFSDIPEVAHKDDIETSDLHPLFSDIPEINGDDKEITKILKNDVKKIENDLDYDLSDIFDESNVDWTGPHREITDIDNEEQDSKLIEQKRFNRLNTQAPAQKSSLFSIEEPEVKREPVLLGGYRTCDLEIVKTIPTLFTILANQNVLKGIHLYLENITECKTQVVNGINYKITTSINEEVCSYVLYRTPQNELSLSSHLSDVPACRAYLTQKFASENPVLV